jgi:hypothetical protein
MAEAYTSFRKTTISTPYVKFGLPKMCYRPLGERVPTPHAKPTARWGTLVCDPGMQ